MGIGKKEEGASYEWKNLLRKTKGSEIESSGPDFGYYYCCPFTSVSPTNSPSLELLFLVPFSSCNSPTIFFLPTVRCLLVHVATWFMRRSHIDTFMRSNLS